MIIFDLIMTLIESFFISVFNSNIFKIKNISYILLSTICIFIETTFFNDFILNNLLLLILIILTCFFLTVFYKRKVYSYYYLIPSIAMAILLLSNTIALFITSFIYGLEVADVSNSINAIIMLSLLSRVIFGAILFIFYRYQKTVNENDMLKQINWIPLLAFSVSLLGAFTTLYESIFYQIIDHATVKLLLFEFLILTISSFAVLYNVINSYRLNQKMKNEFLKIKFSKEIYSQTNKLSYQILKDKHYISYVLITVYNYLKKNDVDNALAQLNKSISHIKHSEISYTTNIPVFDYYIVNTINSCKRNGYVIKTVISLNNTSILEKWEIIEIIKDLLDYTIEYTENEKRFHIQIYDKNRYLVVKFIVPKNDDDFVFLNFNDELVKIYDQYNQDNNIIIKVLFGNSYS